MDINITVGNNASLVSWVSLAFSFLAVFIAYKSIQLSFYKKTKIIIKKTIIFRFRNDLKVHWQAILTNTGAKVAVITDIGVKISNNPILFVDINKNTLIEGHSNANIEKEFSYRKIADQINDNELYTVKFYALIDNKDWKFIGETQIKNKRLVNNRDKLRNSLKNKIGE